MTDEKTLAEWLSSISYKPNWEFKPYTQWNGQVGVEIICNTVNTYEREQSVVLSAKKLVPVDLDSRDYLLVWLRSEIRETELHEADEWLLMDGMRPFDPHSLARRVGVFGG